MIALLNQLPSDPQIKKQLRKIIFGSHLFCPRCYSRRVYVSENRYRCIKCRKPFTLLSGTWLKHMRINLRTMYALLWCWTQRIPVLQSQKLCKLSEKCVRHYFTEFRKHLPLNQAILTGKVQMDEAYFKSLSLLMAKQQGTRNLVYQIIYSNSINQTEAIRFLFETVQPRSVLQTDGSKLYRTANQWWPLIHKVDIHKKFE